ncbi:UDP-2,4-diacetamido-2,4,6-trideoxy-beta-L-altropyranose hydrolase [Evansella halocellulosilytica]|uniref:UDP-2,4-diacetamido-2,4, 6-trideoxy-beta-L-altropyranose hydrolase n=1 Tax=Evansella halocellulosilytica TaxID=2011013 RepID=UPI000BB6F9C6|nr:UDP-2,4-diacetamido-2,4,6-trideoxy-beta-L-altropyranose hydrolase [Evansella halocellulosilytica]
MNILFRTDASVEIGTGHVMRCLTLAKQLKMKKIEIAFICRPQRGDFIETIEKEGFHVYKLPVENNKQVNLDRSVVHSHWLKTDWRTDVEQTKRVIEENDLYPEWMIVDHYALDYKWEKAIRAHTRKMFIIDDLADRYHHCDVLLDTNTTADKEKRYQKLLPNDCVRLFGPQYVLLREEFIGARKDATVRRKVRRILVFFGGIDPTEETVKTIKALHNINIGSIRVDVVVGHSNPKREEIKNICYELPNFFYHCQVDYMAKLMLHADLAIGSGGGATWERCYLGLPTLTILSAENQTDIISFAESKGAIVHLGKSEEVNEGDIQKAFEHLRSNLHQIEKMSKSALSFMEDRRKFNKMIEIIFGG